MTGTYQIPPESLNEMKGAYRFTIILRLGIIYFVFLLAVIVRGQDDFMDTLWVLGGSFIGFVLLAILINAFYHRPLYNTVIQLTEKGITRSGEGLLSVQLSFDEIGSIRTQITGTVLLKKGIQSKIKLYTNRYPYSSEPGIIFIPLSLEKYRQVIQYVREKSKVPY
jgi:hypothetical protein